MKHIIFLLSAMFMFISNTKAQQKQEPWTNDQLMAPKELADRIVNEQIENMLIISVAPDDLIEGSINIGPAVDQKNMAKLKTLLEETSKDQEIVIYCGCCPFDKCPNIRPSFQLLMDMGFNKAKLLDLPKNIKVDWLDKDYPVKD